MVHLINTLTYEYTAIIWKRTPIKKYVLYITTAWKTKLTLKFQTEILIHEVLPGKIQIRAHPGLSLNPYLPEQSCS